MRTIDFINYLKGLVNYRYFVNTFPTTSPDGCATVSLYGGMPQDMESKVKRPSVQILVRGEPLDHENTEAKAFEIFNALVENAEEVAIGDNSVVTLQPNSSSPIFVGLDERERPLYTMNFMAVIRPRKVE